MKKKAVIIVLAVLIVAAAACGIILPQFRSVRVDNLTPAQEVVKHTYSLKELLLLKSHVEIESGFGEVSAKTLAKEVGIKLECRRQTSENGFYYVICGDTHRLFLMTDKAGIVKDVILSSGLPSKEAIEQQIETGKRIGWSLSRMGIPGTNGAEPNVLDGASSRSITYAVLLQDGAVTWKEDFQQDPAQIDYQFYSREAWERLETRPDYLILLPVDTAPWN